VNDDPGVPAAAKVIYNAGHHHHWSGFTKPYEELDPIGLEEFHQIIASALAAADAARAGSPSHETSAEE
jgi:hypothetical protein